MERDFNCTRSRKLIDNEKGSAVWNLVDQNDYNSVVETIPKICSTKLLSHFKQLQDAELVINEIKSYQFELQTPIGTVQYLLLHDKKWLAKEYLVKFLNDRKELIFDNYIEAKKDFESNGFPDQYVMGNGFGYDIALLELYYNLN